VFRWKITGKRSVPTVLSQLRSQRAAIARNVAFLHAQANFIYDAAEQRSGATFAPPQPATPPATPAVAAAGARPAAGDPAQYALAKLRLNEAHSLATGDRVLIAVIDSGIDLDHPELQGVIAASFDALGKPEKPHAHGTAIAGAISARARLLGAAPAARLLAIRAFGAQGISAQSTTFAIIKGVQHAMAERARIINMSFAGPQDPGMARHLAVAKGSGVVLIAATGNLGPKSPPQYPAADPNVIAVSATDASDKLFGGANTGLHVAVTAPGVDILLPAPNADYQLSTGTSFAAAHVSGIAALILERKPDLSPDALRAILISTAKDIGPRGRDHEFGAGLVDAYQAILSLETSTSGGPPAGQVPVPVQASE
jgi:subtilisin family serine protease